MVDDEGGDVVGTAVREVMCSILNPLLQLCNFAMLISIFLLSLGSILNVIYGAFLI